MEIKDLQSVLTRAAALLQAGGAKKPVKALTAVADVLGKTGDATVEEFVSKTTEALRAPEAPALSSAEIAQRLHRAACDKGLFDQVFSILASKAIDKEKALEVAQYYIGSQKTTWRTKPQALKAIRAKFEERLFSAKKSSANGTVTPW